MMTGGGGGGDSSLGGNVNETGKQVYNEAGTELGTGDDYTFTYYQPGGSNHTLLSADGLSEVKVENGKLTLNLGTPTNLLDFSDFDYTVTPSELRALSIVGFCDEANDSTKPRNELSLRKDADHYAMYFYADRDGTATLSGGGGSANLTLKQGWNTVISDKSTGIGTSGTPDSSYHWTVITVTN